jgi:restriction system protein
VQALADALPRPVDVVEREQVGRGRHRGDPTPLNALGLEDMPPFDDTPSVPVLAVSSSPSSTDPLHLLLTVWPLWALVGLILFARVLKLVWEERRLRRAGIHEIDRMDGRTFERRLGRLFRDLGYRVKQVGSGGGDYGGDLLVSKDGTRWIVQAKCWSKNVGLKAVQEVAAARAYYKAERALVVTNRDFTQQARRLARATAVELWGRDELVRRLLRARGLSTPSEPEEPTTQPVDDRAFCARCGAPVSERVRDYCRSHRIRFGGLVYCYEHQRSV